MKFFRSSMMAACLLAPLLSGNAYAQTTASYDVGGFVFELEDLDVLDGVAPAVTFSFLDGIAAGSQQAGPYYTPYGGGHSAEPEGSASFSSQYAHASADYDFLGDSHQSGRAETAALPPYSNVTITANSQVQIWMTVTANTRLNLRADVSLSTTGFSDPPKGIGPSAYTSIFMLCGDCQDYVEIDGDRINLLGAGDVSRTFSLEAANRRAVDSRILLNVFSGAIAAEAGLGTAVPEPDAWALMLVGIGLVAGAGRRLRDKR